MPLTIQISNTGFINVTVTGRNESIVDLNDPNPLPIRYIAFSTWEGTPSTWYYNCEDDINSDRLDIFKQNITDVWPKTMPKLTSDPTQKEMADFVSEDARQTKEIQNDEIQSFRIPIYLKILGEKQSICGNSFEAIALWQKLKILVEAYRELDRSLLFLLANTPNSHLESATKILTSIEDKRFSSINIIAEMRTKMKNKLFVVRLAFEKQIVFTLGNILDHVQMWNGKTVELVDEKQLTTLNKALFSAIDHIHNIIAAIRMSTVLYQKSLILVCDVIAAAKQFYNYLNTELESTNDIDGRYLVMELQTKLEEMRRLEESSNQKFPANIAEEVKALNLVADTILSHVCQVIDPTFQ